MDLSRYFRPLVLVWVNDHEKLFNEVARSWHTLVLQRLTWQSQFRVEVAIFVDRSIILLHLTAFGI